MEKTISKLKKIINEIENSSSSCDIKVEEKKSTSEIINLLLNNKSIDIVETKSEELYKDNNQSKNDFDMDELFIWKEKNNQLFRVEYYRNIHSYRKYISKIIIFFKRIIRRTMRSLVEPIVNDQNDFNASVTASINALYNNEIVTQETIRVQNKLLDNIKILQVSNNDLFKKVEESELTIRELRDKIKQMEIDIQNIDTQNEELKDLKFETDKNLQDIEQLKLDNRDIYMEMQVLQNDTVEFNNIYQKFGELEMNMETYANKQLLDQEKLNTDLNIISNKLENKIDKIELNILRFINEKNNLEQNKQPSTNINEIKDIINSDIYMDIDYFNFENHFRGSRLKIKNAQIMYLKYFVNKGEIIDIGCGRGEFLELLHENSISGIGVDSFTEFVDYCRMKGFEVIEDDALNYLTNLENNTVGGIFASQLAEHLNTSTLISICKQAYDKLIPGSYLIFETPNPTSLSIYTNAFYVDPSHIKPVHPKTLEYFLSDAGFKNIQIIYPEHSKIDYKLPLLEGNEISNLSEFNDGINCISDILFGCQDYAIIAQK